MLPLGFPFPWGYNDYNVTQQNFEPIRENFAYGRSFVATVKANVALFDEMVKAKLEKFGEFTNIIADFEIKRSRGMDYNLTVASIPQKAN